MVLVDMKRADSVDPKVLAPFVGETEYHGVTANVPSPKGELAGRHALYLQGQFAWH